MYLTLQEVKEHLIIDPHFKMDDMLLLHYIKAAEDAVSKYYGKDLSTLLEDGELPASLKSAILLFIGHLYNNREAVGYQQTYELPLGYIYLLSLNNDYSTNSF